MMKFEVHVRNTSKNLEGEETHTNAGITLSRWYWA